MGQGDSKPRKVLCSLPGHTQAVLYCQFNQAGNFLATCSTDKSVIIWSVSQGEAIEFHPIRTLQGHTEEVTCCCFHEEILATASRDKTVVLWRYEKGTRASRLAMHSAPVLCCNISPDGKFLVTTSQDGTVYLMVYRSGPGAFVVGSEMKKLRAHRGAVNDAQFAPNCCLLATASDDKSIRVWDTKAGVCTMCLDDPFGAVKKLCFSPSGNHMISLSGDVLSVWNTEKSIFAVVNVLETNDGQEIQNIALSPEGRFIIGLSKDNKIILWEKMTKKCTPQLRSTDHTRGINTIAISPDNGLVATGDGEGRVFIWV